MPTPTQLPADPPKRTIAERLTSLRDVINDQNTQPNGLNWGQATVIARDLDAIIADLPAEAPEKPEQGLPGRRPDRPDQGLPGDKPERPERPDQGLPGKPGPKPDHELPETPEPKRGDQRR